MLNIFSDGSKRSDILVESLDVLFQMLQEHPLNRSQYRDDYFALISSNSKQVRVRGGFLNHFHYFDLETDEPELIRRLVQAIETNMQRKDYLTQIDLITLWWIADNQEEVEQWSKDFALHKGHIVFIEPHSDNPQRCDVIFNMPRSLATTKYLEVDESDIGISLDYVLKWIQVDRSKFG